MEKRIPFPITLLFILNIIWAFNINAQWIKQPLGIISDLAYVEAKSPSLCYISDDANKIIWKTTNSGYSWFSLQIPSGYQFTGFMYFLDASTGFVDFQQSGADKLFKTTNGGLNWIEIVFNTSYHGPIYFLNNNTGWAYFADKLYKSINGGINWTIINSTPFYGIGGLKFLNESTGYYNAQNLYKTTNGGVNWFTHSVLYIYNIQYVDSNVFYYIRYQNTTSSINKTTNGGLNWITQYQTLANTYLYNLKFYNINTGWAVGTKGLVLHTTNGGLVWSFQPSNDTNDLNNISFSDRYNGWIVGEKGTVLHTSNGGSVFVNNINTEIPISYSLKQNYPNPFNPTTNIKFAIPNSSGVKITVFDVRGKEAEVLVNETLQAGTYQTEWDASAYPSGVYFYKIQTGDFSETKKMMLVR